MATYIIDSQDQSKVTYTGKWLQGGTPAEYNETVMSSTTVGDSFSVSFKGESIAVFGTFDTNSGGVETTYTIDGSSPAKVISQSGSGDTSRQQFWRSNTLQVGDHKLLVNLTKLNLDPSQPGEGTIWFDYFLITDPTLSRTSSSTPNPSQSATTEPPGNSSGHAGLIVGAVIGGLFFLLGVVTLFLFFRRKPRAHTLEERLSEPPLPRDRRARLIEPFRLTMTDIQADGGTSMPIINPEVQGQWVSGPATLMASRKSVITTRTGTSHSTSPSIGNTSTVFLPSPDEPLPSSSGNADINSAPHRDASTDRDRIHRGRHLQVDVDAAPQISPAASTELLEPPGAPVQHVDSGIRTASAGGAEPLTVRVELPPVYSPS